MHNKVTPLPAIVQTNKSDFHCETFQTTPKLGL